jgi:N-acetylneuraminic acid mutarotase
LIIPLRYDYILHFIFLKNFMNKTNPFLLLQSLLFLSAISLSGLEAVESREERLKKLKLPEAVTSFGACRDGSFLYVYGGHVGEAHVYSKKTHSKSFVRINLDQPGQWENLPFNQPLQGFGMAAHKGKIFIAGGSQATNEEDSESNLSSLSEVSYFDVKSKKWIKSTPLPQPRSSHEMVVHKDKLYVLGGWHMENGKGVNWPHYGLVGKITKKGIKWKKLPKTKWTVRANSAAVVGDYVYVIGGLKNPDRHEN